MATWRVNNSTLLGGEVCAPWQPNHAYSLGARVVCRVAYATVARRAYVYECTTAGTSHASTEPTWPTSGTVNDEDIVWTTQNPNDGDWDNASCILHYVLNHTAIAAGDTVYIENGHDESGMGLTGLAHILKGSATLNNPIKMYCVDKADNSLSTGAYVYNASATSTTVTGALYSYGVKYGQVGNFLLTDNTLNTWFKLEGSGTTTLIVLAAVKNITVGGTGGLAATLEIINGSIECEAATCFITVRYCGKLVWKGGSVVAASGVSVLLNGSLQAIDAYIADVDLDAVGDGANARYLIDVADGALKSVLFERCKLPSDAGFALTTGTWYTAPEQGSVRFHHSSSANRTYDFYEESYEGLVQDETTIVRTGGASDGTTPQAWKMISSANSIDNINPLVSPPIASWTDSTTEKTFTIECILDSATNLQNDEVWMEFEYPVNGTDGLGGFARDKCAMLGTPADKTVSTDDWTTTGITNVNKFKCAVTVTPGKAGPITARICLAKASTTIYVDPMITES